MGGGGGSRDEEDEAAAPDPNPSESLNSEDSEATRQIGATAMAT